MVFGGSDGEGYRFVLVGDSVKPLYAAFASRVDAHGGGGNTLVCGSVKGQEEVLRALFNELTGN
jgi:hypothetical protein